MSCRLHVIKVKANLPSKSINYFDFQKDCHRIKLANKKYVIFLIYHLNKIRITSEIYHQKRLIPIIKIFAYLVILIQHLGKNIRISQLLI